MAITRGSRPSRGRFFRLSAASAGSVEDELGAASLADVAAALRTELARRFALAPGVPDTETLAHAEALAPEHRADGR